MSATATWTDWSCDVRIVVDDAAALESAKTRLRSLMHEVARCVDRFDPNSEISQVNDAAGRIIPVSGRTVALVDVALDAAAQTDGLVDPTVGARVIAAGYDKDINEVRNRINPAAPVAPVAAANWQNVRVDHQLSRVGVPAGLRLDLGATAKPWTADIAAHTIAAMYGTGVLIEIGGDIAVAGRTDRPWQVQVSEIATGPGAQVGLASGGLATSSTAARGWRTTTGRAHHIIDPRTAAPAISPWRTATVWARSAVDANVASTAAIILGHEAEAYLNELGLPGRLVDQAGRERFVGDWPTAEAIAS